MIYRRAAAFFHFSLLLLIHYSHAAAVWRSPCLPVRPLCMSCSRCVRRKQKATVRASNRFETGESGALACVCLARASDPISGIIEINSRFTFSSIEAQRSEAAPRWPDVAVTFRVSIWASESERAEHTACEQPSKTRPNIERERECSNGVTHRLLCFMFVMCARARHSNLFHLHAAGRHKTFYRLLRNELGNIVRRLAPNAREARVDH